MFETKEDLREIIRNRNKDLSTYEEKIKDLKEALDNVEIGLNKSINDLKKDKFKLEEKLEKLKLEEKIKEEDIKHMLKIKDEEKDLQFRKKEMELEITKEKEIANVKDSYRDKIEKRLELDKKEMREMYSEVLTRLPNINTRLKISE